MAGKAMDSHVYSCTGRYMNNSTASATASTVAMGIMNFSRRSSIFSANLDFFARRACCCSSMGSAVQSPRGRLGVSVAEAAGRRKAARPSSRVSLMRCEVLRGEAGI